jgi:hypothetical protein
MYNLPAINSNISKTELSIIAEHSINEIIENKNVGEVIDVIAKMEYLIKEIRSNKEFVEFVRGYISLNGKEYKLPTGTKIELAEVGTKYDYSNCNDSLLNELEEHKNMLDEKIKERQQFLKALPIEGIEVLQGDLLEKIYPPNKSSTSSFKVTLPK